MGNIKMIKRQLRHDELMRFKVRMKRGAIEGLAAAESADNASTGGAMAPMLTLGIPGSSATAMMMAGSSFLNLLFMMFKHKC